MCGIAGIVSGAGARPVERSEILEMLASIRHRGPDQFGVYLDQCAGLGSARLSIIDLNSGQMPIANEDGTLWIVFNGEVFNYRELRPELERRGHRFTTGTDTEIILHLYEDYGPECLKRLNGQFAIAIWNSRDRSLFLGRDRLGVRPLYYTQEDGELVFGSEIKAILASGRRKAEWDPAGLDQVFSYWSTLSPRSVFRGITDLPPGCYALFREGRLEVSRYWDLAFPEENQTRRSGHRPEEEILETFRELLKDAVKIRLHADVPVGAYLSGGLDSSTIAALARQQCGKNLDTFSIAFGDERFDESVHQLRMADHLGTAHQVVHASHADIGRVFPDVIWHTETPILRTSPAPMYLLSKLVRDRSFKVVLTGEGADEFLGGYDIFKEAQIRRFWARQPQSSIRPRLFQRLYADIADLSKNSPAFLSAFFGDKLAAVGAPDYSHAVRWKNTRRARRFFSEDLMQSIHGELDGADHAIFHPPGFATWGPLQRAQYLESSIFLSQYLLSSQGDRMGMANSVEGRFPFLDVRVVEFCNALPARMKLRGLNEKYLLKRLGRDYLPEEIWTRRKRPYRAPIHRSFFHPGAPEYVKELLSPAALEASGLFKSGPVQALVKRLEAGIAIGETDDMALAGILSAQLVHQQFMAGQRRWMPLTDNDDIKTCCQSTINELTPH